MRDIIKMAGVDFDDASRHGAVLMTNMVFDCDLDFQDCHSRLETKLVDATSGYNFAHPSYYTDSESGTQYRDLKRFVIINFKTKIIIINCVLFKTIKIASISTVFPKI